MEFYDIDKLVRDNKQNNLYDFFVPTFQYVGAIPSSTQFLVSEEQTMRMDLVSQLTYNTDDNVDILLSINYIDNPLNIMEGDNLVCPTAENISGYRLDIVGRDSNVKAIADSEKSTFVDENRKKFVADNFNITPTSLQEPQDPLKFTTDQIIISK